MKNAFSCFAVFFFVFSGIVTLAAQNNRNYRQRDKSQNRQTRQTRTKITNEEYVAQKLYNYKIAQERLPKNSKHKVWEDVNGTGAYYYSDGYYTTYFQNQYNSQLPEYFAASILEDLCFQFRYKGKCEPTILIQAKLHDKRFCDMTAFEESRSSKDLPIQDFLQSIVKGFTDQCNDLKSIRLQLDLGSGHEPYYGNLKKANNWKLEDGYETTPEDYEFKINVPGTRLSPIGVQYVNKCSSKPVMHLKPYFSNKQHETFYKKDNSFLYFNRIAKATVDKYVRECSNAEEISFTLDYVPTDYRCPEGEECKLVASREDDWKLEKVNYELITYESLMADYVDVIDLLANEEYDKFEQYTDFFRLFYVDFLQLYSEYCGSMIQDPQLVLMFTFDQLYDESGSKIDRRQMGEPAQVRIERNRVGRFQNYIERNKSAQIKRVLQGYKDAFEGNSTDPLTRAILFQRNNRTYIRPFLQNSCNSDKVKKIYEAMEVLAKRIK